MGPASLTFDRVTAVTPEVRAIVAALDDAIAHDFDERQRHGPRVALLAPDLRFYLVRDAAGDVVGCGGVLSADGFAEVKRMYVVPARRGLGIARAILDRLVADARADGHRVLRLETGDVLSDERRLYRRYGFVERDAFPPYDRMEAPATARSVFMELALDGPR